MNIQAEAEYEDRFGEQEQSEARVVNISDEVVRFQIAQQAGSRPRVYTLAANGREGDGVNIQIGYTKAFRGAGRGMVTATIETLTEREIVTEIPPTMGANGIVLDQGRRPVRVAFVCHEDRAPEMRQRYLDAMAKLGRKTRAERAALSPTLPSLRTDAPRSRPVAASAEDGEDQGGGALDEAPPDDDLPPGPTPTAQADIVTIPSGPPGKRGRG